MNVRRSMSWVKFLAWIMLIAGMCFCLDTQMVYAADVKFNPKGVNERAFPADPVKTETGEYYQYNSLIFGSNPQNGACLFRNTSHLRFVISFETIDGVTDYGAVDTSGEYLTYSPSKEVAGKTVKFSLKQIVKSGSSEKESAYSYLFTVKVASSEPEKSGDNALSSLKYMVGRVETEIELTDKTEYEVAFPAETEEGTALTVLANSADKKAKVLISYPGDENGLSLSKTPQTVKITVTAENGDVKEYTVSFRIKEENRMPSVILDSQKITGSTTILRDQNEVLQFTVDPGAEDQKAEHFTSKVAKLEGHETESVPESSEILKSVYKITGRGGSSITFSFYKEGESTAFHTVTANVVTRASYAKLEKMLEGDRIKGLNLDNYTEESVSELKTLLEQAYSIDRNLSYLQEGMLDRLSGEIYQAADPNKLKLRKADYAKVDDLIRKFEAESEFYTEDSVARVREVLAENLDRKHSILEQNFVDEYEKKLEAAMKTLVDLPADYSEYEAILKEIPDDSEGYTDESFAALTKARADIKKGLLKRNQAELDRQVSALRKALDGLKRRFFPVDCSELDAAMALIPGDLSGYTSESVHVLNTVLKNLGSEYRTWDVSRQSEIGALAEAIRGAVSGLIRKESKPEYKPEPSEKDSQTADYWEAPKKADLFQGWKKTGSTLIYYRGGKKQTGWIRADGHWYYAGSDGVQRRGWVKEGNVWYYLSPESGEMHISCIVELDGETYAFDEGGGMYTDRWLKDGDNWYYFSGNGAMKKNTWAWIGGKWYYFYPDGRMAAGVLTPDGETVGQDGVWIKK